jgi:hypothetical protein
MLLPTASWAGCQPARVKSGLPIKWQFWLAPLTGTLISRTINLASTWDQVYPIFPVRPSIIFLGFPKISGGGVVPRFRSGGAGGGVKFFLGGGVPPCITPMPMYGFSHLSLDVGAANIIHILSPFPVPNDPPTQPP